MIVHFEPGECQSEPYLPYVSDQQERFSVVDESGLWLLHVSIDRDICVKNLTWMIHIALRDAYSNYGISYRGLKDQAVRDFNPKIAILPGSNHRDLHCVYRTHLAITFLLSLPRGSANLKISPFLDRVHSVDIALFNRDPASVLVSVHEEMKNSGLVSRHEKIMALFYRLKPLTRKPFVLVSPVEEDKLSFFGFDPNESDGTPDDYTKPPHDPRFQRATTFTSNWSHV